MQAWQPTSGKSFCKPEVVAVDVIGWPCVVILIYDEATAAGNGWTLWNANCLRQYSVGGGLIMVGLEWYQTYNCAVISQQVGPRVAASFGCGNPDGPSTCSALGMELSNRYIASRVR